MPVEFRFARADEYDAASGFLRDYWSENHIYTREKRLFEWTFQRPGYWDKDSFSVAVAEDNGEWVGILGGIPFTLNAFGKTVPAMWIVNYVIRPDHRKGPMALQLLSAFRRPPYAATIAFGINPATSAIYRVLRGEVLDSITRHFVVLPGCEERWARVLEIAYPDWDSSRRMQLANAFRSLGIAGSDRERGTTIPAGWDDREWPEIAARTAGAARDSDYLKWRYLDHPLFEYRFLTIAEGGRHGLLVWRPETMRQATSNGREDVDRIGRLVEFLPVSESNARELCGAFFDELRQVEAIGADYYGYHGLTRCLLRKMGFREADSYGDGNFLPSRFQPIDNKGGNIMSAMFLQPDLPKCVPGEVCAWYWTKSDSDQDRPN